MASRSAVIPSGVTAPNIQYQKVQGRASCTDEFTNCCRKADCAIIGRDGLLYTFPATGISLMKVIPPVRNKVNTTDLLGPSSQAFWADGAYGGGITLKFE